MWGPGDRDVVSEAAMPGRASPGAATRPLLDVRLITGWVAGVTMDGRRPMGACGSDQRSAVAGAREEAPLLGSTDRCPSAVHSELGVDALGVGAHRVH